MTHFPSLVENAIERILELSADVQIRRRGAPAWSSAYRNFSATIIAYGEVLDVLTTVQREHEAPATAGLVCSLPSHLETCATI